VSVLRRTERPGHRATTRHLQAAIRRGSKRIEELFVCGPAWLSRRPTFIAIGGSSSGGVENSQFGDAFPFRFTDESGDIYFYKVRFEAAGWHRNVLYAQLFANRTEDFWSEAQAVRRAKDEVLRAQLDVQQSAKRHVDIGTYLSKFKERSVLVLGDFKHGRHRLEAIREGLDRRGYLAALLDEIPERPHYDLQQKFQAVAPIYRFLVFDDSTPSGHIAEMQLAENLRLIRIILRERGKQSSFMTQGMDLTSTVIREWTYDATTLDAVVGAAAEWAESLVAELADKRRGTYPWRSDAVGLSEG
jgi:hypothetical protein